VKSGLRKIGEPQRVPCSDPLTSLEPLCIFEQIKTIDIKTLIDYWRMDLDE
jgi:hypothetical protein